MITKDMAIETLQDSPEDELGDALLELAVEYWLHTAGITRDELVALVEDLADEDKEDA